MLRSLVDSARKVAREFSELERFFADENKAARRLVFYSEREIFYNYFQDYIEKILEMSDLELCYISSQSNDPVFERCKSRIKPFYFRNTLNAVFSRLDSKVLVMTNPGLNKLSIKRAPDHVKHVYVFHGIASVHKGYLPGSFDYYDSIFCIAPYQVDEIRKSEELYKLKPKELVLTGYPLAERIWRDHQGYKSGAREKSRPLCLIAPTWGPSSIMENCIEGLVESLARTDFEVRLRPHPEFIKRNRNKMRAIEKFISGFANIELELELGAFESLHQADLLITEHSSISFEYALGTERPVLFVDTPMRVDNPEYQMLGMEPVENVYRSKVGTCVSPERISEAGRLCSEMIERQALFRKKILEARLLLLSNWQSSAEIGAKYLIDIAQS